ncbi:hypothetical protein ANANG_G00126950 [Anguilla anguilla]|uniref:Uncharacterized protein n=1 Tax=Anguilla anguilla TaxID=7936 RepID=A0A9D3MJX6_ANGAN|nr:hypothetical protein ANANG_G00126950 [Anguilla anguilla]
MKTMCTVNKLDFKISHFNYYQRLLHSNVMLFSLLHSRQKHSCSRAALLFGVKLSVLGFVIRSLFSLVGPREAPKQRDGQEAVKEHDEEDVEVGVVVRPGRERRGDGACGTVGDVGGHGGVGGHGVIAVSLVVAAARLQVLQNNFPALFNEGEQQGPVHGNLSNSWNCQLLSTGPLVSKDLEVRG